MDALVVPALVVHRVDEAELHFAGVDSVRHRVGELEVLVFVEASGRRRKEHGRPAELSEPQQLHLAAEGGTPPFDVFAVHDRKRALPRGAAILYDPPFSEGACARSGSGCCSGWKTRFPGRSSKRSTRGAGTTWK